MARAALNWGVRDLAAKTGVATNTVSRFENGADALGETLTKIRKVLEAEGIDFIGDTGVDCKRMKEGKAE